MGPKAIALKVDVANYSEVDEMVKTALKEFGKIDILVNNAGLSAVGGVPFLIRRRRCGKETLQLIFSVQ